MSDDARRLAEAIGLIQQIVDPRPEHRGPRSSVMVVAAGSEWHRRALAVLSGIGAGDLVDDDEVARLRAIEQAARAVHGVWRDPGHPDVAAQASLGDENAWGNTVFVAVAVHLSPLFGPMKLANDGSGPARPS